MGNGFCGYGTSGSFGTFGGWGWIGLALNLVLWVGLLAGISLLVVRAFRGAQVPAVQAPYGSGQPTTMEILQAQYAQGEITREQYELKKQDLKPTTVIYILGRRR